jgi:hypothetical protein
MTHQFRASSRAVLAALAATAILVSQGAPRADEPAAPAAWKFGVMADTQWRADTDGENPGTVAAGIVRQLNQQFIAHGVKFVVQVGDLVDSESDGANGDSSRRNMPVRADLARELYDAGIGFFPLRGNHEGSRTAALEFRSLYPQAVGLGSNVGDAAGFSSPVLAATTTDPDGSRLNGLSYSFDYGNARLVLLDQFRRADDTSNATGTNDNAIDQLPWIGAQLAGRAADTHAFVFSHKNLIGQNHADDLFGSNPSRNAAARDEFITALHESGVRYHISGHDHMHHRGVVRSPVAGPGGQRAQVQELICASDSYKFYVPQSTPTDVRYNVPAFGTTLETPIEQELFMVGYYIVTVEGPRVTVDHYASPNGCGGDCDLSATPALTFVKRTTFGYSLNGRAFEVCQDGQPTCNSSYTQIADAFEGTSVTVLGGVNKSTATDAAGRPLTKVVNTGWAARDDGRFASQALTLWGMTDLGADRTDTYTISLSYNGALHPRDVGFGDFGLATRDADGKWVNAVDRNVGGTKRYVRGPWRAKFPLGTYGVDVVAHTAWAVVNHGGDFAVARSIELPMPKPPQP